MRMNYKTKGTCTRTIDLEIEDGVVKSVDFYGGCPGNTTGIKQLVTGMDAAEVVRRLRGIRCGMKDTSCPDQLAQAIESMLGESAS
jgi:uncharacterized protein (TIGR03905 family)